MSLRKRVKCLIFQVLFKLGLIGPCSAGPLPSDNKKSTKTSKANKPKKN